MLINFICGLGVSGSIIMNIHIYIAPTVLCRVSNCTVPYKEPMEVMGLASYIGLHGYIINIVCPDLY